MAQTAANHHVACPTEQPSDGIVVNSFKIPGKPSFASPAQGCGLHSGSRPPSLLLDVENLPIEAGCVTSSEPTPGIVLSRAPARTYCSRRRTGGRKNHIDDRATSRLARRRVVTSRGSRKTLKPQPSMRKNRTGPRACFTPFFGVKSPSRTTCARRCPERPRPPQAH
jgi:hypothetical protein